TVAIGEITPGRTLRDHFGLERAMKSFVLALRLWMVGTTVRDADANTDEPGAEHRPALIGGIAPWRAIIRQHALRQSVTTENLAQYCLHCKPPLVSTGSDRQGEARMVVKHGQRMAAPRTQRKMTFEVHLPHLIRRFPLKPDIGPVLGALA